MSVPNTPPAHLDSMLQQAERKAIQTPEELREVLASKGIKPGNPYDEKYGWTDWEGKPVDLKAAWLKRDGKPNDRIIVAPPNTPALDAYREVTDASATADALKIFMMPREKGGKGGVVSWQHGEIVNTAQALAKSEILADRGVHLLAYGFLQGDDKPDAEHNINDAIWYEAKKLGFRLGFSIGMDPLNIQRTEAGGFSNLHTYGLNEVAATPTPAENVSRAVDFFPNAKSAPATKPGMDWDTCMAEQRAAGHDEDSSAAICATICGGKHAPSLSTPKEEPKMEPAPTVPAPAPTTTPAPPKAAPSMEDRVAALEQRFVPIEEGLGQIKAMLQKVAEEKTGAEPTREAPKEAPKVEAPAPAPAVKEAPKSDAEPLVPAPRTIPAKKALAERVKDVTARIREVGLETALDEIENPPKEE